MGDGAVRSSEEGENGKFGTEDQTSEVGGVVAGGGFGPYKASGEIQSPSTALLSLKNVSTLLIGDRVPVLEVGRSTHP